MSDQAHEQHASYAHVLSVKMLGLNLLALLGLTMLTVFTGQMDLHGFDFAVAMIIATIKATLVAMIFMHLKWDKGYHVFIFLFAILFVGIFLAYTMLDTTEYQDDIDQYRADQVNQGVLNPGAEPVSDPAADPGH
jgi:cytochrome c oxidase subunit IV